ncbi:MAG: hypothetical protein OEV91_03470, partial [Desulfobulbaceae bacterium]|nr:hypothetical protein [Desulfobulbaceae bacterium]
SEGYHDASWQEDGPDGRYPVSMIIAWPDGRQETTLLGSYFVDNQPPTLDLELKGFIVEGKTTFRDRLVIIPLLQIREPMNRWQITFENNDGKILLKQEGESLPPERLFWRGQDNEGNPFPEGDYKITMQVWDQAENMATASQSVAVHRLPPKLTVNAKIIGNELEIDLQHEGEIPIAFWRMELRVGSGIPLKLAEGSNLPARISIPLPADTGKDPIKGVALAQDILGNKSKIKIDDVMALTRPATEQAGEAKKTDESWVDEF